MASEVGVSHVPVPWGKLTKAIVMDAFKDVHTGLGTLRPSLHISMIPNALKAVKARFTGLEK